MTQRTAIIFPQKCSEDEESHGRRRECASTERGQVQHSVGGDGMHSMKSLGQHSCRLGVTKVRPKKMICKALDKYDNIGVGDLHDEQIPSEGRVITRQK